MRQRLLVLTIFALVFFGAIGSAQAVPRLLTEFGYSSVDVGDDSLTLVKLLLGFGFDLGDGQLIVELPTVYASGGIATYEIGNPVLGYRVKMSKSLRFTPSVALPVASLDTDDPSGALESLIALGGGAGMDGNKKFWRWAPNNLSIVLPLESRYPLGPFIFESAVKAALLIPTDDKIDNDMDLILEFDARPIYPVSTAIAFGLGFSGVWLVTTDGDNAQFAFEPAFLWKLSPGVLMDIRFTMNIDEPLGFAFDEGKVWGLHAGFDVALF